MSDFIKEILNKNTSVISKSIATGAGDANILFVSQLTDRVSLAEYVIKPLLSLNCELSVENLTKKVLALDDIKVDKAMELVEDYILDGQAILFLPNTDEYLVLNTKKVEHKSVGDPQLSYTLRGPKDSLVESLESNLSLLRYRIKDNRLKTENFKVGRRTKTNVVMFFLQDVANDKVVNEMRKRISEIDVDGILESGELQQFLTKGKFQIFPQMGIIERSDMAAGAILEGKIVVLVEGSGIALVAPKTLPEYFSSDDDNYDNKFFGTYSKIVRYISIIAIVVMMPLYVAAVTFKLQFFSPIYLDLIYELRQNVPFSPMVEALIMVFIIELLRESLLRVPKEVGGAIGIAAGVILGDAIVKAGILSTFTLIIATLSLLMSFTAPDFTIAHPFRMFQPILIILAGSFGFWGITAGLLGLLIIMALHKSFGIPFLAPLIPFYPKDALKTIYYSKTDFDERPRFLKLKDKRRSRRN